MQKNQIEIFFKKLNIHSLDIVIKDQINKLGLSKKIASRIVGGIKFLKRLRFRF